MNYFVFNLNCHEMIFIVTMQLVYIIYEAV